MMSKMLVQLKNCDLDIWLVFQQQDLKPQYYSFRWITLLLSQEFPLPDVLRIWDTLLSDEKRFDFLIHVCVAMIVILRNQLLEGDFPSNLKLLQNFPPMDVQIILSKAVELSKRKFLANVWATNKGKTRDASAYILTGVASDLIFPHDLASSGRAPESLPSNSDAVFTYTVNSAPFRCNRQ
ncbi:hypothetical protein NQ318_022158 [Aromia moschata]|uniref:Rab-GAP TBC domain-containing protein n=1 Tax=Aromia moschata TaxID=1265417 RepID=A0AAV8Z6C2_9CUCU|nr:hypothetical protein NQ318_022158 [Aromia moschata]